MSDDPATAGSDPAGVPPASELAERADEFRRAAARAEAVAGELTGRQLAWRPDPERWSVDECLEHLVQTGEVYLRVLDEVMEEARADGLLAEGPFRHGLLDRWLVRFLEPPPGLRISAPRIIDPRRPFRDGDEGGSGGPATGGRSVGGGSGAGAGDASPGGEASPLPRFVALQDRLIRRLEAAHGIDLSEVRVRSPFVPLVRMDLGTAFAVVAAHQRRHLWQAERVAAEEGFPGA